MNFSYKKSGVNYDLLDPVKKLAQREGLKTADNLAGMGFEEILQSRGESAYIIETSDCYYAFVQEGLGTKNLVADEMQKITGKTYYDSVAQDTVAMIINDLITVGATPISTLAYWAVGDSGWFADKKRTEDLIRGWKVACDSAQVTWGGGETPTLKNIISPGTIDLAGSAFGVVRPKSRLTLGDKLSTDDKIIMFESSGIHANGLTLVRDLAKKLPEGFATKLSNGKMFGEELLVPTKIYCRLTQDLLDNGVDIHYMVNITGHGWRKLMRAKKDFTYIIDKLPDVPAIFKFIKEKSKLTDRQMYATFNMGAGYAIYIRPQTVTDVLEIAKRHNIKAWLAGKIEKGSKKVIVKPINTTYMSSELRIRE